MISSLIVLADNCPNSCGEGVCTNKGCMCIKDFAGVDCSSTFIQLLGEYYVVFQGGVVSDAMLLQTKT